MIKIIEIENIKGIKKRRFQLDIFPNKPSLLVAPNGFGKSSFATAFRSMISSRINLSNDDFYEGDNTNLPKISLEYEDENNSIIVLQSTNNTNTISDKFDYFVINNLTKPKGKGSLYGKATATLVIQDVVLVDRVPAKVLFGYSFSNSKQKFGGNGKIIPNIKLALSNKKLVKKLSLNYLSLERANGIQIQRKINSIINEINLQSGTTETIINWIENNKLNDLNSIQYLNLIGDIINEFDIGLQSKTKGYLIAIQLIWLYSQCANTFKKACLYSNYKLDKQIFDMTLKTFNCTWKNVQSSETNGKLVVKFPKAIQISNGQRDILTFISMLFKAKRSLNKKSNILIIDEVFDYLDDANLIAAQFYITQFIKEFKDLGNRIYPLILTHLNPNYFKNFAFSKQKVYYLNKSNIKINQGIITLLRKRNKISVKNDISKYLLHYNPDKIKKRTEFKQLGIPELWGECDNFVKYINQEIQNYLSDKTYDPFAVCGALRIKVEQIAYDKLQDPIAKKKFLEIHKTRLKLEKADEIGIVSPESHYLLGIIYNEGMHWKENQDNVSPIAAKLENLTIKKLINDIFN